MLNKYIFLFIVLVGFAGVLYFIGMNIKERKKVQAAENQQLEDEKRIRDSLYQIQLLRREENTPGRNNPNNSNINSKDVNKTADENLNTPHSTSKESENIDFSSLLNTGNMNDPQRTSVAVIILDGSNKINNSMSNEISGLYSGSGKTGFTGLIKSRFLQMPEFDELSEGSSDIIQKMELSKYTDYLVIGKLHSTIRPGTLASGTLVCDLRLSVNIISAINQNLSRSFTCQSSGNGVTDSQAFELAKNNLLKTYSSSYLSL